MISVNVNTCYQYDMSCQVASLQRAVPSISSDAAKQLVAAYLKERQSGVIKSPVVTLVNFAMPSSKKRLWVINMDNDNVIYRTYVAHGKGSGFIKAVRFSNRINSHESSLGIYRTLNTYVGHHGYSLRIQGLQKGVNDNAYRRDVVIHPARYVSRAVLKKYGRMGRTWGCFGLPPKQAKPIENTIKGGTLLYAYYPHRDSILT